MSESAAEAHGTYNICEVDPQKGDDASLVLVLLRDAAFFTAMVVTALAVDSWTADGGLIARVAGALAGFVIFFLAFLPLHEWGHYLGGKLTGAHVPRNGIKKMFPMFHFDMDRSTATQAAAVGIGGNLVLVPAPFLVWSVFGLESAVGAGMIISIAYGIGSNAVVEWPIIIDTIRRGSGSEAWHAYLPVRDHRIRLSVPCGIAAAVAAAVLLIQ